MTENQTRMKEIEDLFDKYKTEMTPEQTEEMLRLVREGRFIVPVTFPEDEALKAMQEEQIRTGKPVPLPKDVKPIPVLLQNPNKERFLAIYTSFKQLPKASGDANGVVEMTFDACMNYVRNAKIPVLGVAVNPFSNNFIIRAKKDQQVTAAQFHLLARKNIEYVLFPYNLYTKGKEYFDGIDNEVLYGFFQDQYQNKLPIPYEKSDFEVMPLGIHPKLDLIYISMPAKKMEPGIGIRLYATWHKEAEHAGYYMIVRGEEKNERCFLYIDEQGRRTDLEDVPVESAEMQRVMELELERYDK